MASEPTKYAMLLRILDALRGEAQGTKWASQYATASVDPDAIQQARSKAFIHLYLKVMFGIADFAERESYVTDGSQDGSIDGYYIDHETRRIYLLQSKFRNTEHNFEQKEIDPKELFVMDIDRITRGNKEDADGIQYNGKIQGLIRRVSEIPDIARYNYHVAIIANCTLPSEHIRRLTGGFNASVFNFERAYNELVFPIVSGTFFHAQDVTIQLDLSNKSAGAKTSYSVETPEYLCEITVLFIPTLEIAKAMDRYRNAILEYNPRSYLDLQDGRHVHASIKETLLRPDSNEFALMNNGITILSDETNLSERIGQHNKAQLRLLRPQIINGGQTAYTLSRAFNEDRDGAEARFAGKEVLTKIITLTPKDASKDTAVERLRLIDEISAASNRQTPVMSADRLSNEGMYTNLQKALFDRYGLLYERKRGEFSDGVDAGYIDRSQIMERNLFLRIFLATKGDLNNARRKRIFVKHKLTEAQLTDQASLDLFANGYALFRQLIPRSFDRYQPSYRDILAKVYLGTNCTDKGLNIEERLAAIERLWEDLIGQVMKQRPNFVAKVVNQTTGMERVVFVRDRWITSDEFEADMREFVRSRHIKPQRGKTIADDVASAEFRKALDSTFPEGAVAPKK
jgi:hypothetical protein